MNDIPNDIESLFGDLFTPPKTFAGNMGHNPIHPDKCMRDSCKRIWESFNANK